MDYYIRIVEGTPFEHPIVRLNMQQAFPDIDLDNLPPEFAKFIRIEAPLLGVYEKNQTVAYELVEGMAGTYTDVFYSEPMTAGEITAKQDVGKAEWAINGFASWTFNEVTCAYEAPVEKPTDGANYLWDEDTLSWV
jgi:hypothetical protein